MRSAVNQTGTKRWLFHWLATQAGGKTLDESWWAREDSNLQPDRYERAGPARRASAQLGLRARALAPRVPMAGTPGEAHHDSGLKHPASARSSRSGEATGAVRGAAPFRSAVLARFVQAAPHTVGVEVLGVDRRTGLLPPGLVQTAGIDAIKAQFFDELQNDGLGCGVIARNWQGDAPGRTCRPAQFEKMSGVNVVERFDHRPANLLLDPAALRQARLDRLDAAVALAWVIVAGIDDNHPVRRIGEQTGREVRNILLRNGNHDEIHAANGFWDRHG